MSSPVVDFDDIFLTAVVLSVFAVWTLLLFLKLKEGGLGLVGDGVASSVGTEGGGTNSATCLGRGRVDGRGMGRGRGIITFFHEASVPFYFLPNSQHCTLSLSLTKEGPLLCSSILSLSCWARSRVEAGYCGYKQRGCCAAKTSSLAASLHCSTRAVAHSAMHRAQKFARAGAMICKLSGLTRSLTGAPPA